MRRMIPRMVRRPRFEVVLDACIDDVREGRRTMEQCLAEWPGYAEQLEPLLRTAVHAQSLTIPEATPDPVGRARFMATIRATPQRSRHGWMEPLAGMGAAFRRTMRVGAVLAPAAAVAVFALVLISLDSPARAQASTLSLFSGGVERARGVTWVALEDGAAIAVGDRLRTNASGRALLTFADGSTVAIDPDSELTIERAIVNGQREIALRQDAGRLWHHVMTDGRPGSLFVVHTPDASVVARGTVFETSIVSGETAVSTASGLVEVVAADRRVEVPAGEAVQVRKSAEVAPAHTAARKGGAELSVDAPFVASLIGPDGRATGALPNGFVLHQIPGVVTGEGPSGAQHIAITQVPPGEYTLVLRRTGEGSGAVVLSLPGGERTITLPDEAQAVAVGLRVQTEGAASVVVPGQVVRDVVQAEQQEKVVVTEGGKARAEEARKRQQEKREQKDSRAEQDGQAEEQRGQDAQAEREQDEKDKKDGQAEGEQRDNDDERRPGPARTPGTETPEGAGTPRGRGAPERDDTERPGSRGRGPRPAATVSVEPARAPSATATAAPSKGRGRSSGLLDAVTTVVGPIGP